MCGCYSARCPAKVWKSERAHCSVVFSYSDSLRNVGCTAVRGLAIVPTLCLALFCHDLHLERLPRSPMREACSSAPLRDFDTEQRSDQIVPLAHGDYTAHTNLACRIKVFIRKKLALSLLFTYLLTTPADASSRCGTKLITPSNKLNDVLLLCGKPIAQATDGPAIRNTGVPHKRSQKTDVIVYGPNGGAYQYMLFINDQLIKADVRRKAPTGNILKW